MDSESIFILAAMMLKKLGGRLTLDLDEFQSMASAPASFVIDGLVDGDQITVRYKQILAPEATGGMLTVN